MLHSSHSGLDDTRVWLIHWQIAAFATCQCRPGSLSLTASNARHLTLLIGLLHSLLMSCNVAEGARKRTLQYCDSLQLKRAYAQMVVALHVSCVSHITTWIKSKEICLTGILWSSVFYVPWISRASLTSDTCIIRGCKLVDEELKRPCFVTYVNTGRLHIRLWTHSIKTM